MKKILFLCLSGVVATTCWQQSLAADAPNIGGSALITTSLGGAITNAGGALSGGQANIKQAVTSVLSGSISGSLEDNLSIKGAITNIGGAASGGKANVCQAVGTIGDNCASGGS